MSDSVLLEQAKQTEVETDHSKVSKGGPRLPAVGKSPARLVGYVELGTHPQEPYKGQAKDPCMEVQLTFECLGAKNVDEIEVDNGDGTKTKKSVGRIIRPLPMTVKLNERAKFYKQFKDMDYGRGLDHMSKMLNDVFLVTIEHAKSKKGTTFAKIARVESPFMEVLDGDGIPTGDTVDITPKVKPASYPLQLFVVEKPTFEQWESIFIDGTYTRKTKNEETGAEVEEEVSKNFLQTSIQESLDWEGSAMQALLLNLEEEVPKEEPKKTKTKPKTKTKVEEVEVDVADEQKEEVTEPSTDPESMFAELGLEV